jgi:phospholipid-translocating ATPase
LGIFENDSDPNHLNNKHIFNSNQSQAENYQESLNLENTLWCNTILATGKILGIVIFIGKETRSSINTKEA